MIHDAIKNKPLGHNFYHDSDMNNIESKNMSIREYVFLAIPFVFLTIIVGRRIKSARKKA